jgi:hypothetical protein
MDTKEEIDLILSKVSEQAHEIADQIEPDLMSAEEIVVAAVEIVTNTPVTTIEYSSPIATIDKESVMFSWVELTEEDLDGYD